MKSKKYFLYIACFFCGLSFAADSFDIQKQTVDIISDGIRLSADVYRPKSPDQNQKFPAIIMSNGWGGLASHLIETASDIARSGYVVVVIDYKGWGNSDAKLIQIKDKDGKYSKTRELREIVDPIDQAEDIFNTINWTASDKQVDASNLGLWGTSLSGGLVVYVAARDRRIKALVSQVGGMGWGPNYDTYLNDWNSKGAQRSRGRIEYPQPGINEIGNLKGAMIWEKFARFRPIEDADKIKNAAALFVVAQNEELMDNKDNSLAAFNKILISKDYIEIPNIKHYDIYSGNIRKNVTKIEIDWYNKYLKGKNKD